MPDFTFERAHPGPVCGVDEAGRGPLAGSVAAAAVWLDPQRLPEALLTGLNDSKKLSARKRDTLFDLLLGSGEAVRYGIASASVEEIDRLNILRASHLAMERAVLALHQQAGWSCSLALIDGNQAPREFPCPTQCVIKGDSLSLSIAAASILAKVTRDREMLALDRQFPVYGWQRNMGYGTAEHRAAIATHGPSPHHRRSFARQGELFG